MPLKTVPATQADTPDIQAAERRAFGNSPINNILYPGPFLDNNTEAIEPRNRQLQEDTSCRWVKVIDTSLTEKGEHGIIAYSCWYIWDIPREKGYIPPHFYGGVGTDVEVCDYFFGGHSRHRDETLGGKPHIWLMTLFTDPNHQRRGAGTMLLKWGTEQADRLGLPLYLDATADGKRLYEKHDFRVIDKIVFDFAKWGGPSEVESVVMVRQPS